MPKYKKTADRAQFYDRVLSAVQKLPGVRAAAYISFLPMAMRGGLREIVIKGRVHDPADPDLASLRFVTPGFFSALGIPLLRGRDVSESDTGESPLAAVASESFMRRYFPGENPLDRRFQIASQERSIVGVVGDIRVRGLDRTSEPQVYFPYKQVSDGAVVWYAPKDLVIRSSSNPAALVPLVRRIVRAADPEQPVSDVRMLSDIVDAETAPRLVQVRVLGAFALIAILLAGIGIHGLLSFTVSHRSQETGLRIALGAQSSDILRMVLRDSVRLAVAGVIAGMVCAYLAGRALESLLAGVRPEDLPTFLTAAGLSVIMTIAGSFVPAFRAVRVDPAMTIRAE